MQTEGLTVFDAYLHMPDFETVGSDHDRQQQRHDRRIGLVGRTRADLDLTSPARAVLRRTRLRNRSGQNTAISAAEISTRVRVT